MREVRYRVGHLRRAQGKVRSWCHCSNRHRVEHRSATDIQNLDVRLNPVPPSSTTSCTTYLPVASAKAEFFEPPSLF